MAHKIIDKCPNCISPDKAIPSYSDGTCGVCAGSGEILMEKVCNMPDQKWIEEFDKQFPATHNIYPSEKIGYLTISEYSVSTESLKQFITTLLEEQRKDILKEVIEMLPKEKEISEGRIMHNIDIMSDGYNDCLGEIKEKLNLIK